ncbi:MAG TPA: LptA/OstA family protein [Chthoniobacterales bacterium]|nr:LptA/OstA family protein [Chthoniobacterales bacterium]
MMRFFLCAFLLLGCTANQVLAQGAAGNGLSSPTKTVAKRTTRATSSDSRDGATAKDPIKALVGGGAATPSDQAMTTEIFANEAYFDSKESIGTFTGQVIVKDPRFNLQADKLTVYLGKGEVRGLDHAIAEGNVGVVREAPGENGAPPVQSVGRADRAFYTAKDGNVELSGTPRVMSGLNTHVATSPETVMVINQSGQLTTRGPSRTEIRQEPKAEATPKP